jgi:putative membrane protein
MDFMNYLTDLANISIYVVLGLVIMLFGSFAVDLVIPCSFPEEIKKKNQAVGWISAGAYIATGFIIRSVIASPAVANATDQVINLYGLVSSTIYSLIGIAFLVLGYIVVKLFNRKYDLNKEIGEGNAAAGIMVFGIFVGLSMIVSGAIA